IEYYTGFIFEIHCDYLGPVSQVCGGGRYDRLLAALGAPQMIPALGFAMGIGQVEEETIWRIAQICRQAGWRVRAEFDHRRLKDLLGHASEEEIPYVIIVGEDELRDQSVKVKDMAERREAIVAIDQLDAYVRAAMAGADQDKRKRP